MVKLLATASLLADMLQGDRSDARCPLTETRQGACLHHISNEEKTLNPYESSTSFLADSLRPKDSIDKRLTLLYSCAMCFVIWGTCYSSGVVLARVFNHFPAFPREFRKPLFWMDLALASFVYSVAVFCILGLIDLVRPRKSGATALLYLLFSILAPAPWAFFWILCSFPLNRVAVAFFMYAIPNLAYSAYRVWQNQLMTKKPAQSSKTVIN